MAEIAIPFVVRLLGIRERPASSVRARSRATPAPQTGTTVAPATVVTLIKQGLPSAAFDLLCEALEVPRERLSRLVNIPARTLARRKVFKPEESERIYRLGRLYQRAVDVLGSEADARAWLCAPQKALGGVVPLDYADSEPGAREVEDLLGQLEHGVFS